MAQNKDLKTAVQLKREYTKLLKEQTAMESKLLRYQQEGIDLTGEEKREFVDLKKATEEAGKAAAKAADKRTKAGKKSKESFRRLRTIIRQETSISIIKCFRKRRRTFFKRI